MSYKYNDTENEFSQWDLNPVSLHRTNFPPRTGMYERAVLQDSFAPKSYSCRGVHSGYYSSVQ